MPAYAVETGARVVAPLLVHVSDATGNKKSSACAGEPMARPYIVSMMSEIALRQQSFRWVT